MRRIEGDSGETAFMQQLDKAIDSNGALIEGAGDYEVYWYFDTESEGRPLLFVQASTRRQRDRAQAFIPALQSI